MKVKRKKYFGGTGSTGLTKDGRQVGTTETTDALGGTLGAITGSGGNPYILAANLGAMQLSTLVGGFGDAMQAITKGNAREMRPMSKNTSNIYAMGGTVGRVPVNVEDDEVAEMPNGKVVKFKGKTHAEGGINIDLPEGTKIFSDRIGKFGKSMQERKLKREKEESKLEKLLSKRVGDKAVENTVVRRKQSLEMQEQKDLQIQGMLGQALQQFAYGGIVGGGDTGIMPVSDLFPKNKGWIGSPVFIDNFAGKFKAMGKDAATKELERLKALNSPTGTRSLNVDTPKGMNPQIFDEAYRKAFPVEMSGGKVKSARYKYGTGKKGVYANGTDENGIIGIDIYGNPIWSDNTDYLPNPNTVPDAPKNVISGFNPSPTPYTDIPLEEAIKNVGMHFSEENVANRANITVPYGDNKGTINRGDFLKSQLSLKPKLPTNDSGVNPLALQGMEEGQFTDNTTNRNPISSFIDTLVGVKNGTKLNYSATPYDSYAAQPLLNTSPNDKVLPQKEGEFMSEGDILGYAGGTLGGIAPLMTTLFNRMGDKKEVNTYKNFGAEGIKTQRGALGALAGMKRKALMDALLSRQTMSNTNRNSARGVNTQRALDIAGQQLYNKQVGDINNQFAGLNMGQLNNLSQTQNQVDQMRMGGEDVRIQRDIANRDKFFTNINSDLRNAATGIQTTGKNLNKKQEDKDFMQLLGEISQYGFSFKRDAQGNLTLIQK